MFLVLAQLVATLGEFVFTPKRWRISLFGGGKPMTDGQAAKIPPWQRLQSRIRRRLKSKAVDVKRMLFAKFILPFAIRYHEVLFKDISHNPALVIHSYSCTTSNGPGWDGVLHTHTQKYLCSCFRGLDRMNFARCKCVPKWAHARRLLTVHSSSWLNWQV